MWLLGQLLFGLGTLSNLLIEDLATGWIYWPRAVNVLGASFVFSSSLAYITQLEAENDSMRADLLLWNDKEAK